MNKVRSAENDTDPALEENGLAVLRRNVAGIDVEVAAEVPARLARGGPQGVDAVVARSEEHCAVGDAGAGFDVAGRLETPGVLGGAAAERGAGGGCADWGAAL